MLCNQKDDGVANTDGYMMDLLRHHPQGARHTRRGVNNTIDMHDSTHESEIAGAIPSHTLYDA